MMHMPWQVWVVDVVLKHERVLVGIQHETVTRSPSSNIHEPGFTPSHAAVYDVEGVADAVAT